MDPRVSFITLAVRDVAASRSFYVDGLGWDPVFTDGDGVLMFQVADKVILSLWNAEEFTAEVGSPPASGTPAITLAHNLPSRQQVDEVLARADALGRPTHRAVERTWGGYTGYFVDPDGFRWEIAYNPGPIGSLVLP